MLLQAYFQYSKFGIKWHQFASTCVVERTVSSAIHACSIFSEKQVQKVLNIDQSLSCKSMI